uniref:RING-type domain-containing protein n=1 Tax=Leersia perrieri TaxID=77586 RepID=A0A0D9VYT9_9ORYZ
MGDGEVRVRREALAARLTCPLCKGLFREATAITECLHTFCKECIMEKIDDEEIDCCPVCDISLGGDPEEKLRPDHNIQDIRNKVFPIKTGEVGAPKAPTVTLPVKRKERSLSSLVVDTPMVVDTPRVAMQTGMTGRRTKAARRTAVSHVNSPGNNGAIKLENKSEGRDHKTEKISAAQSTKMTKIGNKKQNNTEVDVKIEPFSEDRKDDNTIDKKDLKKPLNSLLDATSRTKFLRPSPKGRAAKKDKIKNSEDENPKRKDNKEDKVVVTGRKVMPSSNKVKLEEENNGNSSQSASSKDKTTSDYELRKGEHADSQQRLIGSTKTGGALHDEITTSVWFSLVPSPDQKGDPELPQLPAKYLRLKNGSLQVSSIQRYIKKKLDLANEDEVEITCHGEVVHPSTTLQNLRELWLNSSPTEEVEASLGAQAEEFVMVLEYRRPQQPPSP